MKKKFLVTLLSTFAIIICMASLLTGCNNSHYKLYFCVDDAVYATLSTTGNEVISVPQDPIKEGYTFDGWYWDNNVWEKPFTAYSLLDTPISSNKSVYAKFSLLQQQETKINAINANGKMVAYQGKQQENGMTFANAINIDNQYFFYYFYLGTVSKVPICSSVATEYKFDTEVTFTFNELTEKSITESTTKSRETINTHSYTGGFTIGFNQEFTVAAGKLLTKAQAVFNTSQETDHHWTKNWGYTATDSQTATSAYLTQFSQGYSERATFSKDSGFILGNFYRISFYDSVSAYGVLAYEVATNTYSTTTDFVLRNNSRVRVWEESKSEMFEYQQEKNLEFDVNAAIEYAESHKLEFISDSAELGDNPNNPYLISNADDFVQKIAQFDGGNKYFRLTKDIDFSGKTISPITNFFGNLDGAGYTINNLNIQIDSSNGLTPTDADAYYIGLFQYVYGNISNLNIKNANLCVDRLNKRIRVGTLAGGLYSGTFTNCSASGEIQITNNENYNTAWVGGLIGYAETSQVTHCKVDVALDVKNVDTINCGGMIGRVSGSKIDSSFAQGNITINGPDVISDSMYVDAGGLAGRVVKNDDLDYDSTIQNSYATGNVYCDIKKGKVYAGGLVGRLYNSTVEFAYAIGEVTAKNLTKHAYAAGLIAVAQDSKITNVFSASNVFARGNYQGLETEYSFYGHIFASESNLSLWKLYFDKNASFKTGKAGTELKWETDFYTGVSNSILKSTNFQVYELKLDKNIWSISNGSYPTII